MSQQNDDIALLKGMRDRGDITADEYNTLRRHVLWGTPLPEILDNAAPAEPPLTPEINTEEKPPSITRTSGNGRPVTTYAMPTRPAPRHSHSARPISPGWAGAGATKIKETLGPFGIAPVAQPYATQHHSIRRWSLVAFVTVVLIGVMSGVWWFVIRAHPSTVDNYAKTICDSMQGWQQDVHAQRDSYQRVVSSESDASALYKKTVGFYQNVEQQTVQLAENVREAGTPRVDNGKRYADHLYNAIASVSQELDSDTSQATDLDPQQPTVVRLAVQALSSDVDTQLAKIPPTLMNGDVPPPDQLAQAFRTQSSCAEFLS